MSCKHDQGTYKTNEFDGNRYRVVTVCSVCGEEINVTGWIEDVPYSERENERGEKK